MPDRVIPEYRGKLVGDHNRGLRHPCVDSSIARILDMTLDNY
jgi:hypothetical protein